MEFCSKYGYNYGFQGSDSEEYSDEDEQTKRVTKKKTRKADTNIIAVKFDRLVASNEMFAGEPKSCKKCGAVMSFLSEKNTVKEDNKIIWTCEFCAETNDMTQVIIDMNEIPKKDDVTFILELPKAKEEANEAKAGDKPAKEVSADNGYLAFTIDISGSMDTYIPVNNADGNGNNSFTRLNGVKGACMETLKKLKDDEPQKRVAVVTFSDLVKYFGDCTDIHNDKPLLTIGGAQAYGYARNPYVQQQQRSSNFQRIKQMFTFGSKKQASGSDSDDDTQQPQQQQQQQQIESTSDDLNNREKIITFANNLSGDLKGIAQSHAAIEQRIKHLHTEGSTALGPALLFSIAFAAKKPGSSVILCTDGCANVGMGSIESGGKEAEKFYDDLADYAKERGVVVNVISMEGTDCKLALLGRVADRSNGDMSIVNPLNLGEEFKSILSNRVVATNVTAKLIVNHKYLYIRDEKLETEESKAIDAGDEKAREELEAKKQSVVEKNIGNANIDTEITYEYGIRRLKDETEKKENLKEMPFQLQVTYTSQDGTKAVRVYTKLLEFTTKRDEAEKNIVEQDILWAHNAQMMSKQVLSSNAAASKFRGHGVDRLAERNAMLKPQMYSDFSANVQKYSKSKQSSEMNDHEAEEAFLNAKMSRMKMAKKK